jgi:hypothetical protein
MERTINKVDKAGSTRHGTAMLAVASARVLQGPGHSSDWQQGLAAVGQ